MKCCKDLPYKLLQFIFHKPRKVYPQNSKIIVPYFFANSAFIAQEKSHMTINLESVLHETLIATGHVECCAIFRRKDCSVKATSMGYQVR